MTLRIRRGTQTERDTFADSNFVFESGEPVFTTGTGGGKLYIGDDATPGGVLINPSIVVDSEAAADPSTFVETVVVERSRSVYEIDDDGNTTIDLGRGNNFRVSNIDPGTQITLTNPSDGQSGYFIIEVNATGGDGNAAAIVSGGSVTIFTPTDGNLLAIDTTHFVAYTVGATNEVYITAVAVASI